MAQVWHPAPHESQLHMCVQWHIKGHQLGLQASLDLEEVALQQASQ